MTLASLFDGLCDILSDDHSIESNAKAELRRLKAQIGPLGKSSRLKEPFLDVMARDDAHPICSLIGEVPFHWAPPETSSAPLYKDHSHFKAHVELLGPTGLVTSSKIRLGLYGMLPHSEYGIRTHPAEETYIMLAGSAFWKVDDAPFGQLFTGQRSYHPSMVTHATRTGDDAFMSIYIWDGDIAAEKYRYFGLPED